VRCVVLLNAYDVMETMLYANDFAAQCECRFTVDHCGRVAVEARHATPEPKLTIPKRITP